MNKGLGTLKRLPLTAVAAIIIVGCFWFVAHTATDLDDLKFQASYRHVRLEPPEYGQADTAFRGSSALLVAGIRDELWRIPAPYHRANRIQLKLRI
jgi:hypothetical protein